MAAFHLDRGELAFASHHEIDFVAALATISGVKAVTVVNSLPLSNNGWNTDVTNTPNQSASGVVNRNIAMYFLGQGGPQAVGLRLLRGRFFNGVEYGDDVVVGGVMPSTHAVVVTRTLARRLWPAGSAIGKQMWSGKDGPYTVVGIVANVLRPNETTGLNTFAYSAFFPAHPVPALNQYVIGTAPQDRERVLRQAVAKLESFSQSAVVTGQTFTSIRK